MFTSQYLCAFPSYYHPTGTDTGTKKATLGQVAFQTSFIAANGVFVMNDNTTRAPKVNIWWPMYPADFAADTGHLSNEEIGIYVQILNFLWRNGNSNSADIKRITKLVGVTPRKLSTMLDNMHPLITVEDEKLHCAWLSVEQDKAKTNSETKRRAANKRWGNDTHAMHMHEENVSTCNAHASDEAMHMQCPSPSPSPSPVLPVGSGGGKEGKKEKNGDGYEH